MTLENVTMSISIKLIVSKPSPQCYLIKATALCNRGRILQKSSTIKNVKLLSPVPMDVSTRRTLLLLPRRGNRTAVRARGSESLLCEYVS